MPECSGGRVHRVCEAGTGRKAECLKFPDCLWRDLRRSKTGMGQSVGRQNARATAVTEQRNVAQWRLRADRLGLKNRQEVEKLIQRFCQHQTGLRRCTVP